MATSPYCTLDQAKRLAAIGFICAHDMVWIGDYSAAYKPNVLLTLEYRGLIYSDAPNDHHHPAPTAEKIIMAMPLKVNDGTDVCELFFDVQNKKIQYIFNTGPSEENGEDKIFLRFTVDYTNDLKEACIQLLEKLHALGIPLH
jgi:hypothetical protein